MSKPLSLCVLESAEAAAARLDQWRSNLLLLTSSPSQGITESSFLGLELRGAAVVATMAELENLLREFLSGLSEEVNSSGTQIMQLKHSLRSLAVHSNLESLMATTNADVMWSQRLMVTTLETNSQIARFPVRNTKTPPPPLDGRTIKPSHILRIWAILGLPDGPFPVHDCETSLVKLGSLRNDVAHRNIPIGEVFRQPATSASDLAKYIDDVVLLILHLGAEWSAYSAGRAYRA